MINSNKINRRKNNMKTENFQILLTDLIVELTKRQTHLSEEGKNLLKKLELSKYGSYKHVTLLTNHDVNNNVLQELDNIIGALEGIDNEGQLKDIKEYLENRPSELNKLKEEYKEKLSDIEVFTIEYINIDTILKIINSLIDLMNGVVDSIDRIFQNEEEGIVEQTAEPEILTEEKEK